jgi:hypothetical protein
VFIIHKSKEKIYVYSDYEIIDLLAEAYYSDIAHYKKINKAIWQLFETQKHLWLSDIKTLAANLSLDIVIIRDYISLITESDDKPQFLNQLFYQLDENGQLKLIDFSLTELLTLTVATTNRKNKFSQESENWLKSTLTCWQDVTQAYESILEASFNNPSNSLWAFVPN